MESALGLLSIALVLCCANWLRPAGHDRIVLAVASVLGIVLGAVADVIPEAVWVLLWFPVALANYLGLAFLAMAVVGLPILMFVDPDDNIQAKVMSHLPPADRKHSALAIALTTWTAELSGLWFWLRWCRTLSDDASALIMIRVGEILMPALPWPGNGQPLPKLKNGNPDILRRMPAGFKEVEIFTGYMLIMAALVYSVYRQLQLQKVISPDLQVKHSASTSASA